MVAGAVPPELARRTAEVVGAAMAHGSRSGAWGQRRVMVGRHLSRVLGYDPGPVALAQMVDRTFASYARYWAESLRIPALSARELAAGMRYDGYEHIAAGRRRGNGTILVLPHLGGWEWAGAHLASVGHPVSVVVERLEPPELFAWFTRFRQGIGMNVIPAGPDAAARCVAALRDNHLLCLLSDRLIEGTTSVDVEFFGEVTGLPAGPATLALRTGAALLPCAVYFGKKGGHHLGAVHPALEPGRTGRLRDDVTRLTGEIARHFETLIRAEPTQWHLMQPNWPSDLLH